MKQSSIDFYCLVLRSSHNAFNNSIASGIIVACLAAMFHVRISVSVDLNDKSNFDYIFTNHENEILLLMQSTKPRNSSKIKFFQFCSRLLGSEKNCCRKLPSPKAQFRLNIFSLFD